MKKKVMLLLPTLEWGGAEKQAILFAQFLKSKGIEVGVGSFAEGGVIENKCHENKIKCYKIVNKIDFFYLCIWIYAKVNSLFLKKNKYIFRDIYSLYKIVKTEKITHIIAYCAVPGTIAGMLKKYIPELYVVWFQRDAGIYNSTPKYQSYAVKKADSVLANSISGKNWIKSSYGRDAKIIYNSVVMPKSKLDKREWYAKLNIKEDVLIVSMVANLSKAKDHLTLLKAWKIVRGKIKNQNIILVLAGRFDEKYEELKEFVSCNNMEEGVRFLGLEEDVIGLLEASAVFAFSAISEGTSNAIIEASMCGLCTVATDLPEIEDILCDSNKKFLFKKGDYEDCARKLLYAIQRVDEREVVGRCNKEKAENLFQSEKNFNQILKELSDGT